MPEIRADCVKLFAYRGRRHVLRQQLVFSKIVQTFSRYCVLYREQLKGLGQYCPLLLVQGMQFSSDLQSTNYMLLGLNPVLSDLKMIVPHHWFLCYSNDAYQGRSFSGILDGIHFRHVRGQGMGWLLEHIDCDTHVLVYNIYRLK